MKNKNSRTSDKNSRDRNEERRETRLYPEGEKEYRMCFQGFIQWGLRKKTGEA